MINERQNDDHAIEFNRAAASAHRAARNVEWLRYTISLILVLASVIFIFLGDTIRILAVAGFAWAMLSLLALSPAARARSSEAASVQEYFDTYVYQMKWGEQTQKVDMERVYELSNSFKGDVLKLRDYYPNVRSFAPPVAILICQRSNLTWDIMLRRRWKKFVLTVLLSWLALGIVVGLAENLSTWDLIQRWYAPSLGAISLGWEIIRAQNSTLSEKLALKARVSAEIDWSGAALTPKQQERLSASARVIQDGILDVRMKSTRVPQFFYDRYRDADDKNMKSAVLAFEKGVGVY